MSKICTKCGQSKDMTQFYIRNLKPISICKSCTKERVTKYAKTDDGRFVRAMAEAKFRNKEWEINKNDYLSLLEKPCFYCDGILDDNGLGIGLDRVKNSFGYTLTNVVRCCSFCNYLRGDLLTLEETKALIGVLISLRYGKAQKVA